MANHAPHSLSYLLTALLLLWGCDAFDGGLLESADSKPDDGDTPTGRMDAGPPESDAAVEDSGRDTGVQCDPVPEVCNGSDDDCDGAVDEDTVAECEGVILNADTGCFPIMDGARCLLVRCDTGFANCDGDPTNGCEKPFCDCNPCETDAGVDDDGGL